MATQVQNFENRLPQRVLQLDGIFELMAGGGLLLTSESVAHWIGVSAALISLTGIATLGVGLALLYISQRNVTRQILQTIALLNLAWVVISGFVLVLEWNVFASEGRWLIALIADVVLVLGIAELYARRHTA